MKRSPSILLCVWFPAVACAGSGGRSASPAPAGASLETAVRDAGTTHSDLGATDAAAHRHQADASTNQPTDTAMSNHPADASGRHSNDATRSSHTSDAAPDAHRSDASAISLSREDGGSTKAVATDAATSAQASNEACPDGMVLIDGDYCENLEMSCLRSTYAPQNQKTICWDFKEPTVCTGSKTHKRFCIDRYEYPNKKDSRPRVMVNFPQAQALCADQGKRMCTETEWTTACEGPNYKPYPYGYHRDPTICRGDQPYPFPDLKKAFSKDRSIAEPELARTYAAVPSGSQPGCVSDYGVYDMPGNADELASSETAPPRSTFDNVTTGGPWLEGVRNQCRPKIYTHNEGFAYYYLSFRCCAEADGKPSDPRSPKQIKREEKWRRVPVPAQVSPPVSAEPRRTLSP